MFLCEAAALIKHPSLAVVQSAARQARRPRLLGRFVGGFLIVLASGRAPAAQTYEAQTEGLMIGRVIFHPSIALEYGYDTNVFYQSADLPDDRQIASGSLALRGRFLVDVPFGPHRLRLSYAPVYRDYTSKQFRQTNLFNHYLDVDANFLMGSSLKLDVRDHFVKGTSEVQEVDPGGELIFGLVPFIAHQPEMEIGVSLGARHGLSLIPRYSINNYAGTTSSGHYNYRRREIEGRYNYRLSEPSLLYAFYSVDHTVQDRELAYYGDVSFTARKAGLALRRTVNQAIVSLISAGYEQMDFEGGTGRNYSGPIVDVETYWQMGDATRLEIGLLRQPYQSFYVNNNFYVDSQVRLRLTRQFGPNAYWEFGAEVHRNLYADPIDFRVGASTAAQFDANGNGLIDTFETLTPSIGVRRQDDLRPNVRLYVGYNFDRRSSNISEIDAGGAVIDPFHYVVNRFLFRVETGWL